MPTSTKWRLYITSNYGGSVYSIAEVQMRGTPGGADECVGGTASASSAGSVPANAFDDSAATFWYSTSTGNQWLQYEFGTAKNIVQITLQARPGDSANQTPKAFQLQYYDGSVWTTVLSVDDPNPWALGETRTFYVPDPDNPVGNVRVAQVGRRVLVSGRNPNVRVTQVSRRVLVKDYSEVAIDSEPPTPGAVTVSAVDGTSLTVNVGAGSDNVGVVSRTLRVYSDAGRTVQVGADEEAAVGDNVVSGLSEVTTYYIRVVYADAAGNTANGDAEGTTLRRPRTQVVIAG